MYSIELAGNELWLSGYGEVFNVLKRCDYSDRWQVVERVVSTIRAGDYIIDDKRGPLLVVSVHEMQTA